MIRGFLGVMPIIAVSQSVDGGTWDYLIYLLEKRDVWLRDTIIQVNGTELEIVLPGLVFMFFMGWSSIMG